VVTRSLRHITAQIVDDTKGHTLASASTLDASLRGRRATRRRLRRKVGACSPSGPRPRASARSSSTVVATGTRAHRRLADAAREAGLEF
jgi:large subunit ribosomal protein L18